MSGVIGPEVLRDFERSSRLEWLETNGLGGWAMSTVAGAHTRRYHGLLVAATRPPVERMVLLSRLDETVRAAGGAAELWSARFPGAIAPRGHERLARFERDVFPVFEYDLAGVVETGGGGIRLRKTVVAVWGENTTLVLYELGAAGDDSAGDGAAAVALELRPFYAVRGYHELRFADRPFRREAEMAGDVLIYRAWDGAPAVHLGVPGASFEAAPDWWLRFELQEEIERGFDGHEDLFTPGVLRVELEPGQRLGVVVSAAPATGRDAFALASAERWRRQELLRRVPSAPAPMRPLAAEPVRRGQPRSVPRRGGGAATRSAREVGAPAPPSHALVRALVLAADQFLVRRGERGTTVIAGYPWFTDWGRDTMIALPGLCLVTGRPEEAKGILRAFAAAVDSGMVPNRFPDGAETPEYNTVDATLWFFVATWRYLEATGDQAFVERELLPVLDDILDWHRRGTRHGIHQDEDGLLYSGEPGVQLTWMDARIGDWVVTPRRGKPVEIQALWYNALRILAELRARAGREREAATLEAAAERARTRFVELFWNAEAGCLRDCVDQRGGAPPLEIDDRIRPNQVLALSLPFEPLDRERAAAVLAVIEARLVTPYGLRSLDPAHSDYRPRYEGGPVARDSVYHQGAVWSWLLGPYLTALVRLRGDDGRVEARRLLVRAAEHLAEGCVGSVSEIFD
ncbi:MAG TPA: amylo-alpha-1,6-glucosidase, partial [Thermoanaerobaculia bacterium]|nr:amylo-alpha-1,6-glucosidase [Thermoanaerobaculia bacterium]